jgi:large subunit ribosomal protein L35
MPKLKSKSGATKRFKKTAGGYKHRCANRSHHFTAVKSQKRKRHLRGGSMVSESDRRNIDRQLPYAD